MSGNTYKVDIKTRDGECYEVIGATYECDGLLLIINQGEDQYIFPMDFVEHVFAEVEE